MVQSFAPQRFITFSIIHPLGERRKICNLLCHKAFVPFSIMSFTDSGLYNTTNTTENDHCSFSWPSLFLLSRTPLTKFSTFAAMVQPMAEPRYQLLPEERSPKMEKHSRTIAASRKSTAAINKDLYLMFFIFYSPLTLSCYSAQQGAHAPLPLFSPTAGVFDPLRTLIPLPPPASP